MPRTEPAVAIQVKRQALEQSPDIAQPIAAAFQHFELIVEPFDKGAGLMIDKVVRDQVKPAVQQREEAIKAPQPALAHALSPEADTPQSIRLRAGGVEDGCQFLAQRDGLPQSWAVDQKSLQLRLLLVVQIGRAFARRPQDVFELVLQFVGQRGAQPTHLVLAQRVDRLTIVPRDVEAVDDDGGVRKRFLHRADVALPHIGTDGLDAAAVLLRYGVQPGHHGRLEPIRQDGQDVQAPAGGFGAEHGDEIAMALFEGDLVDAEHTERFKRLPVNRGGNPAVEDAEQRIVADIFFRDHIGHGAVDQLDDQMALIGFGMQRVWVVPVKFLRGGRVIVTVRTAKAFGTNTQIDHSAQNREMAQQARPIFAVLLGEGSTAAATGGRGQGALHREDELVGLCQVGLEHAHDREYRAGSR